MTLVCNHLFTNDEYTTLKVIKHVLHEIGYEKEAIDRIIHMKIIVSSSFISDLSSFFIPTDMNKNVLAKMLCNNISFLNKLKPIYSYIEQNINHHFAFKNIFYFINDYGFVFLNHRILRI